MLSDYMFTAVNSVGEGYNFRPSDIVSLVRDDSSYFHIKQTDWRLLVNTVERIL